MSKRMANILQTSTKPNVKRRSTTATSSVGNKNVNGNENGKENGNENGNENSASAKKKQVETSSSSSSIPSILPEIPLQNLLTSKQSWSHYDKSPPAWENGPTTRMLLTIFYHSIGFSNKVRECVPGLLSYPYQTVEDALIKQYKKSPTEVYNENVAQLSFPTPWQVLVHVKLQDKRKAKYVDGKIQRIICETCQKMLQPMSQDGKTRKHQSLNDNKKCVGSGQQGAVVWLSKEELDVKRKEYDQDNRERLQEYSKQYSKQYRKDNKEKIIKKRKQYYQDNRERFQEQRNENRKQDRESYELIQQEGGLEMEAITNEINAGYSFIRAKVLAAKEGQISVYIMAGGNGRFCGPTGGGYSAGSVQHGEYT